MNKMQTYLLLIMMSSAVCYATTFPLGTYSYLGNKEHVYDNRDDFTNRMQELGYNTNLIEIFSPGESSYYNYEDLYTQLNTKGIKAIVMDKRSNDVYSSYGLSTGSYQRFEAEYKDGGAVALGDNLVSKYWYRSNSDTQERVGQLFVPDNRFWLCSKDSLDVGFAYTDLKYRWNTVSGDSIRIGQEFYIKKLASADTSNYIYITYAFIISNVDAGLDASTPLLAFMPCGYPYSNNGHASTAEYLPHEGNPPNGTTTYYRLQDLNNSGGEDVNVTHTIKIKYSDLLSHNLMVDGSSKRTLVNLNPRLYWYANCDLKLDYIEFEDQLFHDMSGVDGLGDLVLNPVYQAGLNSAISSLLPAGYPDLVSGIYTLDEPRQGQWEAYRMVQNEIPISLSCMTASYDWQYNKFRLNGTVEPNAKYYNHIDAFRTVAEANITMPDIYPLRPENEYIDWNSENGLQKIIDNKVVEVYQAAKEYVRGHTDRKFYPVVQAFGYWDKDEWLSWILPPPEMQKMLQYLPLCFDPDGIFNYRLFGYQTYSNNGNIIRRGDYAALYSSKFVPDIPDLVNPTDDSIRFGEDGESRSSYGAPVIHSPTYNALKEANAKVLKYAELIKGDDGASPGLVWNSSNVIGLTWNEGASFLANMHLADITVDDVDNEPRYQGYVQCGYYQDSLGNPAFMVVNRRANYFQSSTYASPRYVPVAQYSSCFPAFNAQTLLFGLNPDSYATYGTFPALYDPADEHIYISDDQDIQVSIDAGDGKLLKMCSSLPASVTSDAEIKNIAYLSGLITIDDCAEVTIHAGTQTTILPHSTILVKGNSILNLAGIVTVKDTVNIIVEDGSSINFNEADCTWGESSILKVTGGTLSISGGSMGTKSTSRWTGIRVSDSSQVLMDNATISNAQFNAFENSNCMITNSRFYVPGNSYGLLICNTSSGYTTEISNTMPGKGFYGTSDQGSTGIYLSAIQNQVNISNVNFHDLETGISKDATPYAIDTVNECRFVNCKTGITLFFNGSSTVIEWSKFTNDQPGQNGTGINLIASSPSISNCYFNNLYCGVQTESSLQSVWGTNHTYISESNFNDCNRGIESRNSNHYLKENYFYNNNDGIVNHASSNLNLSYNKNNVMKNIESNILFYDTLPYQSTIQLLAGHNDFYHMRSAGGSYAVDFCFDVNYYDSQGGFGVLRKINASDNWFEGAQVTVNDPLYADYVYVDSYDLLPSMPPPGPNTGRLFMALDYESQELYELAAATFKAMIDEDEEDEKSDVTSAIDGLYRCTFMIPDPSWELTDYFDTKAMQCAIDDPNLSAILKDYLAKVFVLNKEFQDAVDLIQLRIDNPISEIDSLRAVLDMEIVLQLAAMEDEKRPLTTKYVQYQYPDVQIFEKKHSDNWDKYSRLLLQNNADTSSLIAPMPLIQSNYPNPFNPSTTITFSIPEASRVRVSVYNLKGQKVKDLINADMLRGNHKLVWDGKDAHNRKASSGIYFLRLESGGKTSIRKTMLMK